MGFKFERNAILLLVSCLLAILIVFAFRGKEFVFEHTEAPPDHSLWDQLLKKHVSDAGKVSYKGFIRDSMILNKYLDLLSRSAPDPSNWSRPEQLAYWINAYNAFTIRLVIRYYPVQSIKDISGRWSIPFISSSWDIKFIEIGGKTFDLNNIEHGIIRKEFDEPRIHFALNCASKSCPVLRPEAYKADKLDAQLEDQTLQFINDPRYNHFESSKRAFVSKLFLWYGGDFRKNEKSVIGFINRYSNTRLDQRATLKYKDYDWSLNE